MDEHDATWCEPADLRTLKTLRAQGLKLPDRPDKSDEGLTRQPAGSGFSLSLS